MAQDAFWAAIYGRRSVRRYAPRPVAPALIERLLEAAHQAPSAHNRQPWRFVLLEHAPTRGRLAEAMAASWRADQLADDADPQLAEARAVRSIERITTAPAVILPCLDLAALDVYPDPQRQQHEWQMGVHSVALACQNLLLAAQHLGLGACWLCAPIFCTPLVQAILGLPATLQAQALITLGYPAADAPATKPRTPLATRLIRR